MSAAEEIINNLAAECRSPRPFLRRNFLYSRHLPVESKEANRHCRVKVTHVDVRLDQSACSEGAPLVERSYLGTILGAIVTGDDNCFQVHSVARSLIKVTAHATPGDHEVFAAKYVLKTLPKPICTCKEGPCSWPQTCTREEIPGDDDHRAYNPTHVHTGLCGIPGRSAEVPPAALNLRLRSTLQKPRLLVHLVDAVQHRLETIRRRGPQYKEGCLRQTESFIDHFAAATDARIALMEIPEHASDSLLRDTLTANLFRVRATVSKSAEHPGTAPDARKRLLSFNKAAAAPNSSDAVQQDSDRQRVLKLAGSLCDARGGQTYASLAATPLDDAVKIKGNSVTIKEYHAVGYSALPTLRLKGCPFAEPAAASRSAARWGGLEFMTEVQRVEFHVELSTVEVAERAEPGGPSCDTLEICHKDRENRNILVERVEAQLCPACGMACSSAAGLYAHMEACHEAMQVTFEAKRSNGRIQKKGDKIRWKLNVPLHVQPEGRDFERRNLRQNFMFWRGRFQRPPEASSAAVHASFQSLRLLRAFENEVTLVPEGPIRTGLNISPTSKLLDLVLCPKEFWEELQQHSAPAQLPALPLSNQLRQHYKPWAFRPKWLPFNPYAMLPSYVRAAPVPVVQSEANCIAYPLNSPWPCTLVEADQPHNAVVGYGDKPFHASGAAPQRDAEGTYLVPDDIHAYAATPSHGWVPGATPLLSSPYPRSPAHNGSMPVPSDPRTNAMPGPNDQGSSGALLAQAPGSQAPPTHPPDPPTDAPRFPSYAPGSSFFPPGAPVYMGQPHGSPSYANGSPQYVPSSPHYPQGSPAYDPGSPVYAPSSPIHEYCPDSPPHQPFSRPSSSDFHRGGLPVCRPGSPDLHERATSLPPNQYRKASKARRDSAKARKQARARKQAEAKKRRHRHAGAAQHPQSRGHARPALAFAPTQEEPRQPICGDAGFVDVDAGFDSIASVIAVLPEYRESLRALTEKGAQWFLAKLNAGLKPDNEAAQLNAAQLEAEREAEEETDDSDAEDSDEYIQYAEDHAPRYSDEEEDPQYNAEKSRHQKPLSLGTSVIKPAQHPKATEGSARHYMQRHTSSHARASDRAYSIGAKSSHAAHSARPPDPARRGILQARHASLAGADRVGSAGERAAGSVPARGSRSLKRQLKRSTRVDGGGTEPAPHRSPASHQRHHSAPAPTGSRAPHHYKRALPSSPPPASPVSQQLLPPPPPPRLPEHLEPSDMAYDDNETMLDTELDKHMQLAGTPAGPATPASNMKPATPSATPPTYDEPRARLEVARRARSRSLPLLDDRVTAREPPPRMQLRNRRAPEARVPLPTRPAPPLQNAKRDSPRTQEVPAAPGSLGSDSSDAATASTPTPERARRDTDSDADAAAGTDADASSESVESDSDEVPDAALDKQDQYGKLRPWQTAMARMMRSHRSEPARPASIDSEDSGSDKYRPQSREFAGKYHLDWKANIDGPVFFGHLSRQPLGAEDKPGPRMLEHLNASDEAHWMHEFRRLMRLCKQRRCGMQETVYILRFEEFRFRQPHSRTVMVPSLMEGFILRHREWIQGDAAVREVCHAHLLRLTRLRLLAPLQTQHCLKMLNGTHTPCPDYMFDHLRSANFVAQADAVKRKRFAPARGNRTAASAQPRQNGGKVTDTAPVTKRPVPTVVYKRPPATGLNSHAKHARAGQRLHEVAAYQDADKQSAGNRTNHRSTTVVNVLEDGRQYVAPTVNKEALKRIMGNNTNPCNV